jgi:anti-sigma regulatory factor (Ser/Thr protein kinase)
MNVCSLDRSEASTELVVSSAASSIASVRRYAVDRCARLGWSRSADTVALLVSEVATNAVLHAYGPQIRVTVLDVGGRLRVSVADGSAALPVVRPPSSSAEGGRGLALVQALSAEWGVDVRHDGKTFWFEVEASEGR